MPSIVKQFRALKETRLIFDTYRFNGQKFAASVFNDCIVCADDEKLLKTLHKHVFTFVNLLQSFPPEMLSEWREFLIELINDVTAEKARSYDSDGYPERTDDIGQLIDEFIAENKKARENMRKLADAAAKLHATINKSKKLIADWEC